MEDESQDGASGGGDGAPEPSAGRPIPAPAGASVAKDAMAEIKATIAQLVDANRDLETRVEALERKTGFYHKKVDKLVKDSK